MCYVFLMRPRTKGMGERGEILDAGGNFVRTRRSIVLAAKWLRKRETTAEMLLWDVLQKASSHGLKFYRQKPIDRYIVDFYCPRKKLVIEVDGGIHDSEMQQEKDALREEFLRTKGLRVLRFRNEEISRNLHGIWLRILEACGMKTIASSSETKHTHPPSARTRTKSAFLTKEQGTARVRRGLGGGF